MELILDRSNRFGEVEYIDERGETKTIGLSFDESKNLVDYSGEFFLPKEVIELIRSKGFTVTDEYEE